MTELEQNPEEATRLTVDADDYQDDDDMPMELPPPPDGMYCTHS